MFDTIRRHQKWLLFIIVAATIVSFVIYFDPSQGSGNRGGGNRNVVGEIGEHKITPREFNDSRQETRLLYYLNFRKWPEQDEGAQQRGFDLDREATLRVVRVVKAKEAGITVSDQTVGEVAQRLLGNPPDPKVALARFEQEILRPAQVTTDDFERFIRHDAMIQQLSALYGAAGRLVTPAEAEEIYRREYQEVDGRIAFFSITNYMTRVAPSNEALLQWYTNQMPRYRTPEQVRVNYMFISRSNFLADAEKQIATISNLTARIEEQYYRQGTNTFTDTNGTVLPREKALAKIKEDLHTHRSMLMAMQRANEVGSKLEDILSKTNQPSAAILEQVAKTENLPVGVTQPFDMEEGPTNLNVAPNFTRVAFSLNASNNPVAVQPIEGENGFFIIALKDTTPSKQQSFEQVKNKVTDDYKRNQGMGLLRNDAMDFLTRATNAIQQGKSFEQVAAEAKVKVVTLPPISRTTESITNLDTVVNTRQVKSILLSLEPNGVSQFVPNPPDGGYLVFNKARLPINEAKMKADMPKFLAEVRYARQNEVFNNWFRKQVEKALPGLPTLNRPQQQQQQPRG